jgi:hypothetical protein
MIPSIMVALFALGILIFVIWLARTRRHDHAVMQNPARYLQPVDVDAFRNLIDLAEQDYLRRRLPGPEFRKIQRERLAAATEYIKAAASNAGILMKLAEPARFSPEAEVARSAQKLIDEATQLRLYAFQAIPRLYVAMIFPSRPIVPLRVAEGYEQMTQNVVALGLQYPTRGVSAAL